MPKKPTVRPEELATFHEAMRGVRPLAKRKNRISPPPLPPAQNQSKSFVPPTTSLFTPVAPDLDLVQSEETIKYKQIGVSNKMLRKLHKGQYNVEATLDLHGMTVAEAKKAVDAFLQQCLQRGVRTALIIHGKGHHSQMPVLKNKLNQWLRQIDKVLAFCSAAPVHGSRGAMYVLLKKGQENDVG